MNKSNRSRSSTAARLQPSSSLINRPLLYEQNNDQQHHHHQQQQPNDVINGDKGDKDIADESTTKRVQTKARSLPVIVNINKHDSKSIPKTTTKTTTATATATATTITTTTIISPTTSSVSSTTPLINVTELKYITTDNNSNEVEQNENPMGYSNTSDKNNSSKNMTMEDENDNISLSKSRNSSIIQQLYVAWVLFFYAGSSLGAIFINKTCLTGYHFRYPLTLVLGQMLFSLIFLTILHVLGYKKIPKAYKQELLSLAIPTALFTSNVVVGLSALSLVNIPMFSAFRRLTLLFVMIAEYIFLKKSYSKSIIYTIIIMTTGAFISAVDDVTFSKLGYMLVFVNNILTASYLTAIKKAMKETNFDPLSLLYYTALLGFPLVSFLSISTGELNHVIVAFKTQPELLSWRFLLSLTLTATGAFAVNFSTSLCTHVTSPLTTSVTGQVKNVLQTILGFFSWGFVPTVLNIVGLLIALGAQVLFAYYKFHEGQVNNNTTINNNRSNSNK